MAVLSLAEKVTLGCYALAWFLWALGLLAAFSDGDPTAGLALAALAVVVALVGAIVHLLAHPTPVPPLFRD